MAICSVSTVPRTSIWRSSGSHAAIATDGRYALAHAGLGEAYWRKYEADKNAAWIDRAVDSCGQALKIDDRLAPVHVTLALIARGRGRYEEAVAVAGRAIELDPVNSDGYRELAARTKRSIRRRCRGDLSERRSRREPDDWLAYNTLGSYYYARARYAEAETAYRRVLDLTPDNTRAYNNLGATLFRTAEARRSRGDVGAIRRRSVPPIRRCPISAPITTTGADMPTRRGRSSEPSTLMPNEYRVWRNLGAALYWAPGERPKAGGRVRTRGARWPSRRERSTPPGRLLAQLADAYSMVGRDPEAREAATALERLNPKEAGGAVRPGRRVRAARRSRNGAGMAGKGHRRRLSARAHRYESPSLAALRKDPRYMRLTAK